MSTYSKRITKSKVKELFTKKGKEESKKKSKSSKKSSRSEIISVPNMVPVRRRPNHHIREDFTLPQHRSLLRSLIPSQLQRPQTLLETTLSPRRLILAPTAPTRLHALLGRRAFTKLQRPGLHTAQCHTGVGVLAVLEEGKRTEPAHPRLANTRRLSRVGVVLRSRLL